MVRTGLPVLLDEGLSAHGLTGARLGFVGNHTSLDVELAHAIDRLVEMPGAAVVALFGPEHGVRGSAQAGVDIADAHDSLTGLPIYSLYGERRAPTDAQLTGIDVLLVDIQDVGVRYATYLSTMLACLRAAAARALEVVVLDRPNPLGGQRVQGNLACSLSFVAAAPVPVRHGLTLGEMAIWANRALGIGARLRVIPMQGWRRDWWFDDTGLPWVPPTPNLPTLASLTLYPGTCLLEGTTLSLGRGTTMPFEVCGAPWMDAARLRRALLDVLPPSVQVRTCSFTPTFSAWAGHLCHGVHLIVRDRLACDAFALGLTLLATLRALYPTQCGWVTTSDANSPPYFIDLLAGGDEVRMAIDGGGDLSVSLARWQVAAHSWWQAVAAEGALLYDDRVNA